MTFRIDQVIQHHCGLTTMVLAHHFVAGDRVPDAHSGFLQRGKEFGSAISDSQRVFKLC